MLYVRFHILGQCAHVLTIYGLEVKVILAVVK